MVSFLFDGDAAATAAMIDRLRLFAIAPSLGGVESLVTQPVTTTHHDMDEAEAPAAQGIVNGLVRLSVGLEEPEDLIADLKGTLGACPAGPRRPGGRRAPRSGGRSVGRSPDSGAVRARAGAGPPPRRRGSGKGCARGIVPPAGA